MMTPYFEQQGITLYQCDARKLPIADGTVQCCVTSPPYFRQRDYDVVGQIGMEETPAEYVAAIVDTFREVRRVLKEDGTVWINLGDSYCASATGRFNGGSAIFAGRDLTGHASVKVGKDKLPGVKPKDLIGIPWAVAFALRDDGWYLRSEIIWHKTFCMPDSTDDRPTRSHEHVFLFSRSARYFYDREGGSEPAMAGGVARARQNVDGQQGSLRANGGSRADRPMKCVGNGETRNRRTVWSIAPGSSDIPHFATFPPALVEPCIKAGSRHGDLVLDPFNGSGTTGKVAQDWGRRYVGTDLNAEYLELTKRRFVQPPLFTVGLPA
jgi:DNA modification methylase